MKAMIRWILSNAWVSMRRTSLTRPQDSPAWTQREIDTYFGGRRG